MYEAIGYRHAAATGHPLATQAAIGALRQGGSAVDAAIAANAMLAVAQPDSCGLGGDLFALVYRAQDQSVQAYSAAGPVGSALRRDLLPASGAMPQRGPLTVTLPGAVAGWDMLHSRYGSLTWPQLFEGAARVAEQGFPLSRKVARALAAAVDFADAAFLSTFAPAGTPKPGDLQRSPDLARTLRALAAEGPSWFYLGPFAEALERTLTAGGGAVVRADMAAFRAEEATPLEATYRGRRILVTPPPSQGVALLVALSILEGLPAGRAAEDPATAHVTSEVLRCALSLRDELLADPRFAPADWDTILAGPRIAAALRDRGRRAAAAFAAAA